VKTFTISTLYFSRFLLQVYLDARSQKIKFLRYSKSKLFSLNNNCSSNISQDKSEENSLVRDRSQFSRKLRKSSERTLSTSAIGWLLRQRKISVPHQKLVYASRKIDRIAAKFAILHSDIDEVCIFLVEYNYHDAN